MQRQRWLFWLIMFLLFMAGVFVLRSVLMPFAAGMVVAYFLDPVADRLETRGFSRTFATTLITLVFVAIMLLGLVLLIPVLQNQIVTFAARLPGYFDTLWVKVQPIVENLRANLPDGRAEDLLGSVGSHAGQAVKWLGGVLGKVLSGGVALFSVLSLLFIAPVVAFYMLRDWDDMVAKIDGWLPRQYAEIIRAQFTEIDRILAAFIRGQATVCIALGVFYSVGLTLVGLDVGVIVGAGAGLISFIPYVGSTIGLLVSVGLALAQFSDILPVIMVAGVFVVGQFLEGNFLTPKLVGESVGLHPVWVIFALMAGGSLFGFLGVLLAVPVSACIGVLVRFGINVYTQSQLYLGDVSDEKLEILNKAATLGRKQRTKAD